jgi:hypothetical protein
MLFTTFNNNVKDYKIEVSDYILYYGQSIIRCISRKAQSWCGRAAECWPIATEPLVDGDIGGWFGTTRLKLGFSTPQKLTYFTWREPEAKKGKNIQQWVFAGRHRPNY